MKLTGVLEETTHIYDWVNLVACGYSFFKVQNDKVYVYDQNTKAWVSTWRTLEWINEKTYKFGETPKRIYL